ncbi:hypothetical protein Droror1_Dr00018422 [Drosera rotundifolia]
MILTHTIYELLIGDYFSIQTLVQDNTQILPMTVLGMIVNTSYEMQLRFNRDIGFLSLPHSSSIQVGFWQTSSLDLSLIMDPNISELQDWKLDPKWDGEPKQPNEMSHRRKYPSKLRAAIAPQDPVNAVKIIDQFVIRRTDNNDLRNNGHSS